MTLVYKRRTSGYGISDPRSQCTRETARRQMVKLTKDPGAVPVGFTGPTAIPPSPEAHQLWQHANRTWWENHPMRYDWRDAVPYDELSPEFFAEIDRRFFSASAEFLPWRRLPFEKLIDFDLLKSKDVLEIGVGNGSHAQLLASHAKTFVGIDVTQYAVGSATCRMCNAGLSTRILQMDAEKMDFANNSFDFIWSWGVIHHSANTRKILEEMNRVLRPGGEAIVMVYYRGVWDYYVHGAVAAVFFGHAFKRGAIHLSVQEKTDGAIARFYTRSEWRNLVQDLFLVNDLRVYGTKTDLFPLPAGRLKKILLAMTPNGVSRFLTGPLSMGSFLVAKMAKRRENAAP